MFKLGKTCATLQPSLNQSEIETLVVYFPSKEV